MCRVNAEITTGTRAHGCPLGFHPPTPPPVPRPQGCARAGGGTGRRTDGQTDRHPCRDAAPRRPLAGRCQPSNWPAPTYSAGDSPPPAPLTFLYTLQRSHPLRCNRERPALAGRVAPRAHRRLGPPGLPERKFSVRHPKPAIKS